MFIQLPLLHLLITITKTASYLAPFLSQTSVQRCQSQPRSLVGADALQAAARPTHARSMEAAPERGPAAAAAAATQPLCCCCSAAARRPPRPCCCCCFQRCSAPVSPPPPPPLGPNSVAVAPQAARPRITYNCRLALRHHQWGRRSSHRPCLHPALPALTCLPGAPTSTGTHHRHSRASPTGRQLMECSQSFSCPTNRVSKLTQ